MFNSIKSKVIVTYSLVIIIFTSVLLLTTIINQKNHVLELELEESAKVSQLHANLLNQEFARYVAMLKMISDDPQVKAGNIANIKHKLNRLINISNGSFINAIYIDRNLTLTDAKGHSHKLPHPLFMRSEQWKDKEYNVSVPIQSQFEKQPVIMTAVPILDNNKQWIGTIAVAVPLTVIAVKLSAIKLTKGSYAWLIDAKGLIVSHPVKHFILNSDLNTRENQRNFPGFNKIFKQTKLQDTGYGRYLDKNLDELKIVTFSKIDYLPGWHLFVTTQESEIFQDIYLILYEVLITSVILMLLFLLLISQLANKLTQPIIQLTKDVEASVNDQENYIHPLDSKNEIGQLSHAFHNAFHRIYLHTNHLKKMVDRRTKEISDKNKILNEQNEQLEELASKDALTGFYNRRAFSHFVDIEMSRAKRHNSPVTLSILDIDHFKNINDTFGHGVGDKTLLRLAAELTDNMRKENLICRWGGEEFVILIPEASSDMVFGYLDKLRKKISQTNFEPVEQVTVSIGIATIKTEESFQQWFKRADNALYKAKNAGRNCIISDDEK